MLTISIVLALMALGSVEAKKYKEVENIAFIAEGRDNRYIKLRTESSDDGPVYWLDILQDITPNLGLQLCEKWEYDTRGFGGDTCGSGGGGGGGEPVPPHNGTIHGPKCRELCCALDELEDKKPQIPGPDSLVGLHKECCPLKKGSSYRIPRLEMPSSFDVDFQMVRDYIDYESYIIPSKPHCPKDVEPFVIVTLVFFPCVTKG